MGILPDWLPNVHPLVVHFPIVLILAAVVLNLIQLIRRLVNIDTVVSAFYLTAAISAICALLTGEQGSEALNFPETVFTATQIGYDDKFEFTIEGIDSDNVNVDGSLNVQDLILS